MEPQLFKEPLQSLMAYKMPENCVVHVYFCGDFFASYDEDDNIASVEVELFNPAGNSVEDFLQNAVEEFNKDF